MKTEEAPPTNTPTQYADLRAKHGPLTVVTVSDPSVDNPTEIELVFRKPSLAEASSAAAIQERDPVGSVQMMAQYCLVHGPVEALDDADTMFNIGPAIQGLVTPLKVEIKKL